MAGFGSRATAALLLVCASATPLLAGKSDNSIRFASAEVLESIDPYFNNARLGVIIGQHVWDTLIYRDPRTNEYKPQLATSWRWIDEKTLEVELREGVKFHDGTELDADDVVYTLNFISRPESKVVNQQNVGWIDLGRLVRLERNPGYFRDSPKPPPRIDRLEIRFIPDRQTLAAEMLAGGIDFMMNVGVDQAQQMRGAAHVQVQFGETQRIAFLHMNTTEGTPAAPLRDIRVRRAILHAVDRNAMTKSIVGEGARVLSTLCFPSQFGCTDTGAPRYDHDPVKAKQLLAEAGYPNGFDIDLHAYRDRQQTEAIANYLLAVGIRANLRFLQFAAMREQVRAGKAALAHETWGTLVNDVSAMTSVFFKLSRDDVNRDEEVRDLLELGDSSANPTRRKEAYAKGLALIQERAYALPLYSLPTYYVAAKDLAFEAPPDELPRFWEMSWR